jgi:formylglycine-generating enzyme required for sulfatase activity
LTAAAPYIAEGKVGFHRFIAGAWLALVCAVAPAYAEKRVALVIGNERYANLGSSEQLQKAVNDARAVGGALRSIGFEVISGENLGRRALLGKLGELVQRLEPGDTAFFFFSGHGVALDGVNYILPADVPDVSADTTLKREALDEPYIVGEMTARGVRVAVVVLDACRTNPFARPGGKGVGVVKGLAPAPQAQGIFSLYAAASGQAALDRLYDGDPDQNSVFSRVLVPLLKKPGIDLRDLAFEVRQEVARIARTAGHDQRPEDRDGTTGGRIYLAGLPPAAVQPFPAPPDAGTVWHAVQNTTSLTTLDDYIAQFGKDPVYGLMARARREQLAKELAAGKESAKPAGGTPTAVAMTERPAVPADGACGVTSTVRCAPLAAERESALKPKDGFRECDTCPEMVVVPAGSFTMGSPEKEEGRVPDEGPQHEVKIARPFAVGKLHVTVDQYREFVGDTGYEKLRECHWSSPGFAQDGTHPVVCVTWEDAKAYAEWLAKKTGKPYRLLSEAEFEYAARGRTSPSIYPRFWFGNDENVFCQYGNGNPCKVGGTSPAGKYKPNAFGLYDMAGNAWQWTEDCWHESYGGAPTDGSARTPSIRCKSRVVRGGGWAYYPGYLRAARRSTYFDTYSINWVGFRVARSVNGPDADHK